MHGLPHEYNASIAEWSGAARYLDALVKSGTSVQVQLTAGGKAANVLLRGVLGQRPADGAHVRFWVGPSRSRDAGGQLILQPSTFHGGSLATFDGDDYFELRLELDSASVMLLDTNRF